MRLLSRLAAVLALAYLIGFLWFAMALPQPAPDKERTDAIVVLTGGEGRIPRGLALMRARVAGKMLIAGVDREVRPRELAAEYGIPAGLMACCVSLDFKSVDTRSNASEAAWWITKVKAKSVRVVTSDWHLRRAALDLAAVAPPGTTFVYDAVPTRPTFQTLFLEYNKLVARAVARVTGS